MSSYYNWECSSKIICPYCDKEYEPTYEETYIGGKDVDCYKEGDQGEFTCDECGKKFTLSAEMVWEFTCDECGKKFTLSAEMVWEYTTETIDGEMTDEEWEEMRDAK